MKTFSMLAIFVALLILFYVLGWLDGKKSGFLEGMTFERENRLLQKYFDEEGMRNDGI